MPTLAEFRAEPNKLKYFKIKMTVNTTSKQKEIKDNY